MSLRMPGTSVMATRQASNWAETLKQRQMWVQTWTAMSSGLLEADRTSTQRANAACSVMMPFSRLSSSAFKALVFIVWNVTLERGRGEEGGGIGEREGERERVMEGERKKQRERERVRGKGGEGGGGEGREVKVSHISTTDREYTWSIDPTYLASCCKYRGTLREEIIVPSLKLDGLDQHRVPSILVRPQN